MNTILLLLGVFSAAWAPQSKTALEYTLTIDSLDVSSFSVQLRTRNAPARFIVAAHAHPEYDDKYWHDARSIRV